MRNFPELLSNSATHHETNIFGVLGLWTYPIISSRIIGELSVRCMLLFSDGSGIYIFGGKICRFSIDYVFCRKSTYWISKCHGKMNYCLYCWTRLFFSKVLPYLNLMIFQNQKTKVQIALKLVKTFFCWFLVPENLISGIRSATTITLSQCSKLCKKVQIWCEAHVVKGRNIIYNSCTYSEIIFCTIFSVLEQHCMPLFLPILPTKNILA